jgi:hypothetical protein
LLHRTLVERRGRVRGDEGPRRAHAMANVSGVTTTSATAHAMANVRRRTYDVVRN